MPRDLRTLSVLAVAVLALTSAAVPASAATPESEALTGGWYQDFLLRDADEQSEYWADRLDAGQRPDSVLRDLTRTQEYAETAVTDVYLALLGREPDAGARIWIDGLQQGMAPEWVEQNVLASPEYRRRFVQDRDWIGELYGLVLGRFATVRERDYWRQRLNASGGDYLGILREIWYADEALRYRVAELYEYLLGRTPDADAAYWVGPVRRSRLEAEIAIASTGEYARAVTGR